MEDVNGKVLFQGYGLKLLNTTRSRTGFICKTDKGFKEVKKNNSDEKTLIFENSAKEHLAQKGFKNINSFNRALDGKPFYTFDGNNYVVEDYLLTQGVDLGSEETLLQATRTLAQMHLASCGFCSEIENTNIGKLPVLYEKRNGELIKIKKWIGNQSCLSDVDLIVLKNYDYYSEKVKAAKEMLENSKYNNLMENAKKEGSFCHNAYKGENIRLLDSGNILVTGFNKCAYDYCIVDLAEFIRRYMKSPDCNVKTIWAIIEEYDKIRSVSGNDKELIFAMLAYPYKFLKICNEYYNRRRVYVSDAIVQKLEKCVLLSEKNDRLLNEMRKS